MKSFKHIYLRSKVANLYKKVKDISEDDIENGLRLFIQQKLIPLYKKYGEIKLFEGGIGPGTFTFPFARCLSQIGVKRGYIYGIDNSLAMLELFRKKFESFQTLNKNIKIAYGFGDLEYKLPYLEDEFNVVMLAWVLHCLNDWKKVLLNVKGVLKEDGLLIMAFRNDEWLKVLSGEFEPTFHKLPQFVIQFWQHYYGLRKSLNIPVDNKVKLLFKPPDVENELMSLGFGNMESHLISWKWQYSVKDFLLFIEEGVWTALGSGVSKEQRRILYKKMHIWLKEQSINPEEQVQIDVVLNLCSWQYLG